MASKGELENRLSRMEATAAREAGGADDAFSLRVLREWSVPDLKRLESILEREESGDPDAAITAAEQAWIDEANERATLAADAK